VTISEVLQGKPTLPAILVEREGVKVAPASSALADLELALVGKKGRENVLKKALRGLTGYDYVFIDSPPSLSLLTVNALNAADAVLIPLQMEVLSLQGLTSLMATVNAVREELNPGLKTKGIVASMFDGRRKLSGEVLAEIRKQTKAKVFNTVIRICVKLAEAPSFAKSVFAYAPRSNGAIDYVNLAKEFLRSG
jgi:chromosome partitioning protein